MIEKDEIQSLDNGLPPILTTVRDTCYTRLDPTSDEIRLIIVLPARRYDDPLSCLLFNVRKPWPNYAALSCCWEASLAERPMTVGHVALGKTKKRWSRPKETVGNVVIEARGLTQNLDRALRSYRAYDLV